MKLLALFRRALPAKAAVPALAVLALAAVALVGVDPGGPTGGLAGRLGGGPGLGFAAAPASPAGSDCAGPCNPDPSVPVRYLGEAGVDSIGRLLANHNDRVFARTDSLYRAGFFGRPGTDEARRRAVVHEQLRSLTGIDYTVDLGRTRGRLEKVDEAALLEPFGRRYVGSTVYPLRFLREGLAGNGGFCMQYDLPQSFDEISWIGGVRSRVYSQTIRPEDGDHGQPVPALVVQVDMEMHKSVDMIYEGNYCGRITSDHIVDRGDTLDLYTVSDIRGMYVRKFGLHRLGAIIAWRSHVEGDRDPAHPRIGACVYFPHIHIELPVFLPSIGLEDLRDFDVPQPVLPSPWFQEHAGKQVEWVRIERSGLFDPWKAVGPRPKVLDTKFPDL